LSFQKRRYSIIKCMSWCALDWIYNLPVWFELLAYFVTVSVFPCSVFVVSVSANVYSPMPVFVTWYSAVVDWRPSTSATVTDWPSDVWTLSHVTSMTSNRSQSAARTIARWSSPRHSRTCWVCRDSRRSHSPFVHIATVTLMNYHRTSSTESCNARGLVANSERWPAAEVFTIHGNSVVNEDAGLLCYLQTTSLVHCSLHTRHSAVSIIFVVSTKWLHLQSTWIYS